MHLRFEVVAHRPAGGYHLGHLTRGEQPVPSDHNRTADFIPPADVPVHSNGETLAPLADSGPVTLSHAPAADAGTDPREGGAAGNPGWLPAIRVTLWKRSSPVAGWASCIAHGTSG
jgi:hypothetical protein